MSAVADFLNISRDSKTHGVPSLPAVTDGLSSLYQLFKATHQCLADFYILDLPSKFHLSLKTSMMPHI